MDRIRLEIKGMSYSQSQSGAYALILGEAEGNRRLPIIIGGFEAQAIAIELEKMKPSRPLTHDLFKNFAVTFNITIKEVVINKFSEGVFFAQLICLDNQNREVEIDSRTSDAIALALRFRAPIFTYETIMKAAGIVLDEEDIEDDEEMVDEIEDEEIDEGNEYGQYTLPELEELMSKAIHREEYERASIIRDEITRRNDAEKE